MMSLDQWLSEYDSHHQDPTNIIIHNIFVPIIAISVLGILWSIEVPIYEELSIKLLIPVIVAILFFYKKLGDRPFLLMSAFASLTVILFVLVENYVPIGGLSVIMFVIGWIFQFYGHRIEGKKPSFLKDLQFLLIGPLWVLLKLFKKTNSN